jgi:hypothetical protein
MTIKLDQPVASIQAAQLATDQAAVLAAAGSIAYGTVLLGQTGTQSFTFYGTTQDYASPGTIEMTFPAGWTAPTTITDINNPAGGSSRAYITNGQRLTFGNFRLVYWSSAEAVSLTRASWSNASQVHINGGGLLTAAIDGILAGCIATPVMSGCVIDVTGGADGAHKASLVGNATISGGDGTAVLNGAWTVYNDRVNPTQIATSCPVWGKGTVYKFLWTDGTYWYISQTIGDVTNCYKRPMASGLDGDYAAQGTAPGGPITVAGATAGLTTGQAYALRLAYSTLACTVSYL